MTVTCLARRGAIKSARLEQSLSKPPAMRCNQSGRGWSLGVAGWIGNCTVLLFFVGGDDLAHVFDASYTAGMCKGVFDVAMVDRVRFLEANFLVTSFVMLSETSLWQGMSNCERKAPLTKPCARAYPICQSQPGCHSLQFIDTVNGAWAVSASWNTRLLLWNW